MRFKPFNLKNALVGERTQAATHHLSDSYCEPLSIRELLAYEPGSQESFLDRKLDYPGYRGSAEFRKTVAAMYPGLDGVHIVPMNGADDVILALMLGNLESPDHVIVHSPGYQALHEVAQTIGCRVDFWRGNPERNWALELDSLHALLQPNTRLVVINTPHNPTGYTMPLEHYKALFELAERRNFVVLSDEIYRGIEADPSAVLPAAACISECGVSIGSMSKSFGMPGLRVGWAATRNAGVLKALANFQEYMNSFVSLTGEFLGAIAIRSRQHIFERNRALIRSNIALLGTFFQKHADLFEWSPPSAGTVRFATLRRGSADDFCEALLERTGVLLASSRPFECGDRHLRIGFGRRGLATTLDAMEPFLTTSARS